MTLKWIQHALVLAAACLSVSCEDKALTEKLSKQRAEIERLKTEADRLKDELGEKPEGDPAAALKAAEGELQAVKEEIEALVLQKEDLQNQREKMAKDFEDYKRKYAISE